MKRILILALLFACVLPVGAQTPSFINFLAGTCSTPNGTQPAFRDSSGAPIARGVLRIRPSSPFEIGGGSQATADTLVRSIAAGSMVGSLPLANPAITSPVDIGYTVTVLNLASGNMDVYNNVPIVADGSGNFDWCGNNTGLQVPNVPYTLVVGPQGPQGATGPQGPAGSGGNGSSDTVSVPLVLEDGNIAIPPATDSADGYLTHADHASFGAKQPALGYTPLNPANNLSDLASVVTARTSLGLGTAAMTASTAYDASGAAAAATASALQKSNNLSDLANVVNARTNLGLGTAATTAATAYDASGAATSAAAAATASALQKANNLSDLANVVAARTNLGLGTAATTAATAYDASGAAATAAAAATATALQNSNNLSDLANVVTARTNLGLGTAATTPSTAYDASGAAAAATASALQKTSNLSDLANVVTARTNLGLGTAATTPSTAYDASGAATAAQAAAISAAEAFSANAGNITTGTVAAARLPLATSSAVGGVKCDGTTITCTSGVIAAVGAGGSGTVFGFPIGATVAASSSFAWEPFFSTAQSLANETRGQFVMPVGGTAKNLYLMTSALGRTQSATGSLVCTLRQNGANTALSVTVAAGATLAPYIADTTDTVTLAAGDLIDMACVNGATAASVSISSLTMVVQ